MSKPSFPTRPDDHAQAVEHLGGPRTSLRVWPPPRLGYAPRVMAGRQWVPPAEADRDAEVVELTRALRETELRLAQAQKMEAVGKLVGGVAHDFNNLLFAITGNLEQAKEELRQDEHAIKLINAACEAAWRGAALTNRLLAWSRRQPLAPTVFDVRAQIEGMMELLRRTIKESIEIRVESSDGLWRCETDPHQFENAVLNLAINARDAMPGGGLLEIRMENAAFDETTARVAGVSPGEFVSVSVSDTGSGISRDQLEKIFKPFYTTKESGKGSGLGLSLVRSFIEQSKGHVSVDSKPGQGSVFRLLLPRSTGNEPIEGARSQPRSANVPLGAVLLLVEDEKIVRKAMVAGLENVSYRVLEASNGQEALALLETHPEIGLVITDVILPGGMNGIKLAEQIRGQWRKPVLCTTGYPIEELEPSSRLPDHVSLLRKPFRLRELVEEIRLQLENRPPGESSAA